ncbi:DNA cytosine methyltransferase [Flavobacterium psychrophilum]|uniref:DNA cytosine methyltransferase n=1 Tax=Flavobacterium psychrophilum TaxID=96345 RepID=UPI000B7C0EC7|nr:DNA cytosine methyltransferase [Flavobacterium psychrophilum]EKT4520685.1 DNA cytosine methyltransferase [Flavobacterium psychrophilum]MCB6089115.1 DNA cytosine methyltransferase [Flavobacterium psychrophilum]MCB6097927.1 DNA cytosine methyltransferase [Flavobacterium psychrophilum]MCB6231536.1 DNA cytosine methyltransferase [Flavobacterium psychrophilum]MEB3379370.1 DNA cytosine methyltransferase [Flavobacterium psychrophilum]
MKNLSYDWQKQNDYPKSNKLKVFGTFVCGGGSTMGYKLAGFEHLGGVEIDKRMAKIYETNHNPKHFYLEDIRDFNQRTDLPSELYDLDILDGSPPCSTFSMSGNRELDWGKEKVFKEGQKKQTLDDLVFVYCDTIAKLRPKVAILENVCGIVAGRAKAYTIEICNKLDAIGYDVQIFQLNSATMGVPQARERVFFIARRKDIGLPLLTLKFNKKPIYFGSIVDRNSAIHKPLWASIAKRWEFIEKGDQSLKFADAKFRNLTTYNAFFSTNILYDDVVVPTLTSSGATVYYNEARNLNDTEYTRISSFPSDFDYCGSDVRYVCGMSVPPLMIARIANEIRQQWFTSNTI